MVEPNRISHHLSHLLEGDSVTQPLLDEWTTKFNDLENSNLPDFCLPIQWQADFDHGQQWWVAPVLINPYWNGLISQYNRTELQQLNDQLSIIYPLTHQYLNHHLAKNYIHYIAYSILFPGSILSYHKHDNPGHRKFHCLMHSTTKCGLMHTKRSKEGRPIKHIHHWVDQGEWITFNDSDYHSAWNFSQKPRTVLVIDYAD